MADFIGRLPKWVVKDPILLWLFNQGWEDPGWGQTPINQVAAGLILHGLAERFADKAIQKQLQTIGQQVVAANAQLIVKG